VVSGSRRALAIAAVECENSSTRRLVVAKPFIGGQAFQQMDPRNGIASGHAGDNDVYVAAELTRSLAHPLRQARREEASFKDRHAEGTRWAVAILVICLVLGRQWRLSRSCSVIGQVASTVALHNSDI